MLSRNKYFEKNIALETSCFRIYSLGRLTNAFEKQIFKGIREKILLSQLVVLNFIHFKGPQMHIKDHYSKVSRV